MNIKYILYYCITKTHAEAMYAYGRIFEISATQNNATHATQCNPNQCNSCNKCNSCNQCNQCNQCNPKQCNQSMQPTQSLDCANDGVH